LQPAQLKLKRLVRLFGPAGSGKARPQVRPKGHLKIDLSCIAIRLIFQ
jgi:hypothetical protein